MKIKYKDFAFRKETFALIEKCVEVLERYDDAGYDMTLRQLYYQLVAADEIPNTQHSYDRVGSIVNDARLAGLIDWQHLVDRTRSLKSIAHWNDPPEIIEAVAKQYRIDKWQSQPYRPEVWIEKEALAGVFERVCNSLDVPFFSCRGYTSQSEMWAAGQRLRKYQLGTRKPFKKQIPIIFHFGDHDPSGMDMTRDVADRLSLFIGKSIEIQRLALNMNQIEEFQPPPNPAKITDSRATAYIAEYGGESWELDALEPDVLASLVRNSILNIIDKTKWEKAEQREREQRAALQAISNNYQTIEERLRAGGQISDALDGSE